MLNSTSLAAFINEITGRAQSLFATDIADHQAQLRERIHGRSVLVLGGAGSIGSQFIRQLLAFAPDRVFVVDTNENELTELVRDLRSDPQVIVPPEFVTLPMDFADPLTQRAIRHEGPFDIVANFAALKHVRSEKNAYTSAYMIRNNVVKARLLLELLRDFPPAHFFCVSTDKAAEPVSLMGASKKLMEELVLSYAHQFPTTTARFANVAFSNGSLLDGFLRRLAKSQPLAAPADVQRYFVSPVESGQLCLLACVLGQPADIFVPKLDPRHDLQTFAQIALRLLERLGYTPVIFGTEAEARQQASRLPPHEYACFFFASDTSGEKPWEQFWTDEDVVDQERFQGISVVRYIHDVEPAAVINVIANLEDLFARDRFTKEEIVQILSDHLQRFAHLETNRYLDQRM